MTKACPPAPDPAPTDAVVAAPTAASPIYPDRLDARLLRISGVCLLATIMAILDLTVVNVAQRTFIAEFDTVQSIAGWTMTGYTLALATVIPVAGWAADRYGTKRIFIGTVVAFVFGSVLCAFATTITQLIAFRMVQGAGGGMLMPVGMMVMTRESGPLRLGRLMAILSIPMQLAPIAGPILGGWLIDISSWRWIFLINIPIGLVTVAFAVAILPGDRPTRAERFDLVGVLLLSPGLASFLFAMSSIPHYGTVVDRHIAVPALAGVALIAGFVRHALFGTDHPLIDLRLFTNGVIARANMTMFVFAGAFFGAGLLLPSYLQQVLHMRPMEAGAHMVPQGIAAMLTMRLAGPIVDRRGPGKIVVTGIVLITTGLAVFTFGVIRQAPYQPTLLIALIISGLGLGCTFMPLSVASMQALAPQQIARGTTLMSVSQQMGGSIGTAMMSMMLTNRFSSSDNIAAANRLAVLKQQAADHKTSIAPAAIPHQALAPGFAPHLVHDLCQAYTAVFALAVGLMALTLIPASFLPRQRAMPLLD